MLHTPLLVWQEKISSRFDLSASVEHLLKFLLLRYRALDTYYQYDVTTALSYVVLCLFMHISLCWLKLYRNQMKQGRVIMYILK